MRSLVLPSCLSGGTSVIAEPNDRVFYQDMNRIIYRPTFSGRWKEVGHCEGGGRNADEAWEAACRMAALLGPGMGVVLLFPLLGPFFFLCSNFPRMVYLFPGS